MSIEPPDVPPLLTDAQRDAGRELAVELRVLAELLNTRDVPADALSGATGVVRSLHDALAHHPERPRWYDVVPHGRGGRELSRRLHEEHSPVRGRANPVSPPITFATATRPDGQPVLRGHARLGRRYEGPPHSVHGGWVAALFDELLGMTQGLVGGGGVTARLTVRYRRPTPVGEDLDFEGWVERDRGRAVTARGTCHARGVLVAEGEALFVRVDFDAMEARMRDEGAPVGRDGSEPPGAP